jgi:hypothetical protein
MTLNRLSDTHLSHRPLIAILASCVITIVLDLH